MNRASFLYPSLVPAAPSWSREDFAFLTRQSSSLSQRLPTAAALRRFLNCTTRAARPKSCWHNLRFYTRSLSEAPPEFGIDGYWKRTQYSQPCSNSGGYVPITNPWYIDYARRIGTGPISFGCVSHTTHYSRCSMRSPATRLRIRARNPAWPLKRAVMALLSSRNFI